MAIIGDLCRCSYYQTDGEQVGICVQNYRVASLNNANAITNTDIANDLFLAWHSAYAPMCAPDVQILGTNFTNLSQVTGGLSTAATETGTATGISLPRQSCGFFRKEVLTRIQERTGRMYVPFPSDNANVAQFGKPSPAYMALLQGLADAVCNPTGVIVVSGGGSITFDPVIIRGTAGAYFAITITGITPVAKWATQKRRGSFGKADTTPF